MRRALHASWMLVLALCVLAAGLIYYAGWTESGLQHIVKLANRRLGSFTVVIRGARGTLYGGLHADYVEVDHRLVTVVATAVDGRVALLPLLWQTIRVQGVHAGTAQVHILPRTGPPGYWNARFLPGLLNIQAGQLTIDSGELILAGGHAYAVQRLHAAGTVGTRDIRVFDGAFTYAGMQVQVTGNLHADHPMGLKGTMRLTRKSPDQPDWLADAQYDGDLERLMITGGFLAPFTADFRGEARSLASNWHWFGKSNVRNLDLRAWHAGGVLGVITGSLQVSGDRYGFGAHGELDPPGLKGGPLLVDYAGNYGNHVVEVSRFIVRHRASGSQLQATGTVGIVNGGPQLDLRGQWSSFRWPLADAAAPVRSATGNYTLAGLWPYELHADGELRVRDSPPMQFRAAGRLGHEGLDVPTLALAAFGGQAQLHAAVRWKPAETWSLAGAMNHLNVAALRPAVSGRLNFNVQATGAGFGEGRTLHAKFTDLGGQVRGQPASGSASIGYEGADWLLEPVHLQLGATRIDLDGRFGTGLDLHFTLDAGDLGLFHDGARGSVVARGRVRGNTASALMLQGSVRAAGVTWGGATLQALDANVDFDPQGSGHANSTVVLERLRIANRSIEHLSFTTAGTAAAHRFELQLGAPPLAVHAAGTARYASEVWRAELAQLDTAVGDDIRLVLDAPTALVIAVSGDDLELGHLCLRGATARFCASGEFLPAHSQFSVSASNLPMRTLTAGLRTDTDFDGTLSLEAHGAAPASGPWSGGLQSTLAAASVRHHLLGGRVETFSLGNGSVQADLDATGLQGVVALDAGAQGSITGRIAATRTSAALAQWPISGELQLQTKSLGFIDSYVAQVDRVSGQLAANLTLQGTLAELGVNGELKVSDAQVDAYQVNLALRDLNFDARLHDNTLQLEGSANAGAEGHAHFNGELLWREALPYGQLHLAGENLRVVNIPEARIQASPDVDMKFRGRRIDVTGTIALPYARLERPDQLTNAVRTSSDERIVSATGAPPAATFEVFSDVTLKLGERVTIDTYGLAGRLSGSLRTVTDDTGFSRGSGELQVEEGKYTAYGRKLDIERGRLQFSNGPLTDPAIDLRAIKKFPDVTAGVNVRGTLRNPRMTFFSDPPVSQSQIVSLLLAGGSLESVQNTADSTQRSNAARSNMLLQGSALLFQQFGSKVGIEDVSVESDLNNETSLVLGRYLSPRLYVSYGISLAEAINTIKMRYTIGDRWTIKTEVGAARSADLVYTIER